MPYLAVAWRNLKELSRETINQKNILKRILDIYNIALKTLLTKTLTFFLIIFKD